MQDISERLRVCNQIKTKLKEKLWNNVLSATVYWSTLTDDFCDLSDYDILLVLKDPNFKELKKLKEIKNYFYKKWINIDFNVHDELDMPKVRWNLYWHNNRAYFFQKEIQLYWKQLIWKNPYQNDFDQSDIINEVIKVINSLCYQARKLLINRELTNDERVRMMKFGIYSVLYALWSKNIYVQSKKDALKKFKEVFPTMIDPTIFLQEKTNNCKNIEDKTIYLAYEFISQLDKYIYTLYKCENNENGKS